MALLVKRKEQMYQWKTFSMMQVCSIYHDSSQEIGRSKAGFCLETLQPTRLIPMKSYAISYLAKEVQITSQPSKSIVLFCSNRTDLFPRSCLHASYHRSIIRTVLRRYVRSVATERLASGMSILVISAVR
jgi:hypothetical protein